MAKIFIRTERQRSITPQPTPQKRSKPQLRMRYSTAKIRAVQGVVSTVQGAYIDVRDQTARNNNVEMRRIYVVLFKLSTSRANYNKHTPPQPYPRLPR